MRQSAQAAGVAPATMTRLAQALGLGGFDGLRAPAVAHLAETARRASPLNEPTRANQSEAGLAGLIDAQARNLASIERNSSEVLTGAAQAVLAARTVCFLGQRASFGIAHHLHYTCDWVRSGTWLAGDAAGAWSERVADLGNEDMLVVVSQAPYTRQVVETAQQAAARGVPVLALTDSTLSPLATVARWTLWFEADSTAFFHSLAGAQALAEALMNEVALQGGETVAHRLSQRQQRHREQRTYWERGGQRPARSHVRSRPEVAPARP